MTDPVTLGVNIDHVATLRQARGTRYPDPVYAAQAAEYAGTDSTATMCAPLPPMSWLPS